MWKLLPKTLYWFIPSVGVWKRPFPYAIVHTGNLFLFLFFSHSDGREKNYLLYLMDK